MVEDTRHSSSRWCSLLYLGRLQQAPICCMQFTLEVALAVSIFPMCVPQSRCIPRRPSNHRAKITARLRIIAAEGSRDQGPARLHYLGSS